MLTIPLDNKMLLVKFQHLKITFSFRNAWYESCVRGILLWVGWLLLSALFVFIYCDGLEKT